VCDDLRMASRLDWGMAARLGLVVIQGEQTWLQVLRLFLCFNIFRTVGARPLLCVGFRFFSTMLSD